MVEMSTDAIALGKFSCKPAGCEAGVEIADSGGVDGAEIE